ncbi:nucleoside-diphosphate kinase, partial [Frankia sp. CpI1-P]
MSAERTLILVKPDGV